MKKKNYLITEMLIKLIIDIIMVLVLVGILSLFTKTDNCNNINMETRSTIEDK